MSDIAAAERLRAWVREDFGIDLVAFDPVGSGADVAAEVWRGTSAAGERYAVNWSGGGTTAGLAVSAWLAGRGVPGVAGPVPTRGGGLWSERAGRRLSLAPWASDEGALDGGMTAEHWEAYGAMLAQVHAMPVAEAPESLPREEHTHERWASAVRVLHGECTSGELPDDHLVRSLAAEWRSAADRIAALLTHADAMGRKLRAQYAPEVVCHGDPHLGNLLLRGAEVSLIDWDDAVLAPRERDLLFVIGGVLLPFAPVGRQEQQWFFAGYGPVDVDPHRLAYYRCVRALEDLAVPAAQVLENRAPEAERAEALALFRGVVSSTGLVGLALASAGNGSAAVTS
ncbi:phosphotransferase enzyme family protein [Saccharopolyspora elongata]|uniref:Aminoglycoside phosphotransferase family protein n=1 Tax=Saccharopolyspora elongata TaxID=2530387 RepID=A0A4R4XZS0_9PSEU|nr:phosphotransferase [Saccharopolyspora elongata]TDD37235.1 aminoglycoside phosphotransferase family protein [Saccharopolyspora elongata]